jgi:nicotinamidase-related amidase
MVEPKGYMKDMKVGKYNAWYFDEILPGEEKIYNEAQNEYYGKRKQWTIDPKKAALLIIDLQNDFCDPEKGAFWLPANTKMMPRMKKMLQFCRDHDIPPIFTAHQHHPSGRDKGLMGTYLASTIGSGSLTEGSWGVEIYPEIEPLPDEWVINHKRRYDSFWETGLDIQLRSLGKDTIILTGCCTNFCCSTTTRSGMQRDYKIAYPYDLNAADDAEIHEQVVKSMARGFARVQSCDEWIQEMKEQLTG